LPGRYQVQIRYRHQAAPATLEAAAEGEVRVLFDSPQRAIAPGQFAVWYDGDRVAGCGEIMATGEAPVAGMNRAATAGF
jgi:tRNA-specific 2-thiouridylase